MKEFSISVPQFYPLNYSPLFPVYLLLVKQAIKFLFKNFPKVPLCQSEIPVIFQDFQKEEDTFHIDNIGFQARDSFLSIPENLS